MGRRPNTHIPFPLVSPRKVNDMGSPASRGNMPPPPPPSRYAQNQQSTPSQRFQFTPTQSPASPLKSFQDLLSERAKTGQGITSEEVLRLSSAAQEAPLLPTAAYLGRDFVPSPSKSVSDQPSMSVKIAHSTPTASSWRRRRHPTDPHLHRLNRLCSPPEAQLRAQPPRVRTKLPEAARCTWDPARAPLVHRDRIW